MCSLSLSLSLSTWNIFCVHKFYFD
jgi:hypothetical protein